MWDENNGLCLSKTQQEKYKQIKIGLEEKLDILKKVILSKGYTEDMIVAAKNNQISEKLKNLSNGEKITNLTKEPLFQLLEQITNVKGKINLKLETSNLNIKFSVKGSKENMIYYDIVTPELRSYLKQLEHSSKQFQKRKNIQKTII